MLRQLPARTFLCALPIFAAACGGGGSSGDSSVPATPLPTSLKLQVPGQAEPSQSISFVAELPAVAPDWRLAWDFGDGSAASGASGNHAYNAPGQYEVTLRLSNGGGQALTSKAIVLVGRFAALGNSVCSGPKSTGWCAQEGGGWVNDLFFLDQRVGWAVGGAGIVKTEDGGVTWQMQTPATALPLDRVRFVDALHGWAASLGGVVLRTEDGGATWLRVDAGMFDPNPAPAEAAFTVVDSQTLLINQMHFTNGIGSRSSHITADGGKTWFSIDQPDAISSGGVLWRFSPSLAKSTDLGRSYQTVLAAPGLDPALSAVVVQDDKSILAYTFAGEPANTRLVLYRSTDAGAHWDTIRPDNGPTVLNELVPGIFFSDSLNGWAFENSWHSAQRTHDGGKTWQYIKLPQFDGGIDGFGVGLASLGGNAFWASQIGSTPQLSLDDGKSWSNIRFLDGDPPFTSNCADPIPLLGDLVWMRCLDEIYRSQDHGLSWRRDGQLTRQIDLLSGQYQDLASIEALWMFDAQRGISIDRQGQFSSTSNGGRQWQGQGVLAFPVRQHNTTTRLKFFDANRGWLIASGSLFTSSDAGKIWAEPKGLPGGMGWLDLQILDAKQAWLLAANGDVYQSSDAGQSWLRLPQGLGSQTLGLSFASSGLGLAVKADGNIWRSTDGGANWTSVLSAPAKGLRKVLFASPTLALALGDAGKVWRSTDAGVTWQVVDTPCDQPLREVFATDPQHAWIVGDQGSVLFSSDGGAHWTRSLSGTGKDLKTLFFIDAGSGWIGGSGRTVLATASGGR